jgi:hypothetical protein
LAVPSVILKTNATCLFNGSFEKIGTPSFSREKSCLAGMGNYEKCVHTIGSFGTAIENLSWYSTSITHTNPLLPNKERPSTTSLLVKKILTTHKGYFLATDGINFQPAGY